jgi:hypothetical protein
VVYVYIMEGREGRGGEGRGASCCDGVPPPVVCVGIFTDKKLVFNNNKNHVYYTGIADKNYIQLCT